MPQFTIELFVDALILALHCKDVLSRSLVAQLLEAYDKAVEKSTPMHGEHLNFYVMLIRSVLEINIDINNHAEVESFLLKFKANPLITKDPELYTTLKNIFNATNPLADDTVNYYQNEIRSTLMLMNTTNYVKRMFGKLANPCLSNDSRYEAIKAVDNICADLAQANQHMLDEANNDNSTMAHDVDFSKSEDISHAIDVYETLNVKNVFTMGLQGFNRALGDARGLKLGESMVINTLPFNGKSLMLLKIARWIVTLNKVTDDFVNPTILFYSLENETPQNLKQLFKEAWVNDRHELPPADIPAETMVKYLSDKFNMNGWHFVLKRKVGEDFGYNELKIDFNSYKQAGYTPLAIIIDYANLMKKGNADSRDLGVRVLYNSLCNFAKSQNCCFITAHQLNRRAAEQVSLNPVGAVKKFNESMLADSTDVQREVDIVIYQHKENDARGNAWLTWKLDKHRYDENTPDKDKYWAYKFNGPIGILDDVNGTDASSTNINAEADDDDESVDAPVIPF